MRALARFVALFAFVFAAAGTAAAEKPEIYAANGAALGGYDVVAYFKESKPVKGSAEFAFPWKGATWHFASAANRDAFKADPAKYAPQYGGYCAFGASQGYAVKTEPEAWKIVDGKLYLNYNTQVRTRWEQDIPGFIRSADKNWPEILKK